MDSIAYLCQWCGSANVGLVEIADAQEVLTCLECNGVQRYTQEDLDRAYAYADRVLKELNIA